MMADSLIDRSAVPAAKRRRRHQATRFWVFTLAVFFIALVAFDMMARP
jgi:hypothetical protein